MPHIVMTGSDVTMYTNPNGSETASRFEGYAQALSALAPNSRLSVIVHGAPAGSLPIEMGNLRIIPVQGLGGVYRAFKSLPTIDLITPQTCTEEAWLCYLFARPRGIPVVPQEHNDPFDPRNYNGPRWRRALLHLRHKLALVLLRFAKGVRTVSPAVAEQLKPYLSGKPLAVLPVPVSITPLERAETGPRLLFVGRLDPQKNVTTLLELASRLLPQFPDLRLDIVGDGSLRRELEAQSAALDLGSCVTFHGWLSYHDLASCYAQANLFLCPSLYEGFGRVILEALICGTPVIASDTAGPKFILEHDQSGLLVPALNLERLRKETARLLDDPQARQALRERGYRTAARFSRTQMSRDWMDFLCKLV